MVGCVSSNSSNERRRIVRLQIDTFSRKDSCMVVKSQGLLLRESYMPRSLILISSEVVTFATQELQSEWRKNKSICQPQKTIMIGVSLQIHPI